MDTEEITIQRIYSGIAPRFGSNHARVFRKLLSTEAKTAKQVIEETGIYRPVVYRIIKDLVSYGLVKQLPTVPAMFFTYNPVQKTCSLINKRKKELDLRIENLKKIIQNSTSLSGEEYLIRIDGGQKLLIDRKTRIELKDEQRLREIKKTIDDQLNQLEKSKLKEWAIYK